MITVTATAHCHRCDWTAAGDWPAVDRSAEKHTKTAQHPTGTTATPAAAIKATAGQPGRGSTTNQEGTSMTEPSEIRPGDKVRHRGTGEEGDVTDVLPFYGGFQGGPETLLLTLAVVRWTGTRQRTVVRVEDLDKLT